MLPRAERKLMFKLDNYFHSIASSSHDVTGRCNSKTLDWLWNMLNETDHTSARLHHLSGWRSWKSNLPRKQNLLSSLTGLFVSSVLYYKAPIQTSFQLANYHKYWFAAPASRSPKGRMMKSTVAMTNSALHSSNYSVHNWL